MIPLSDIAPLTEAAEASDIVTYLKNGGRFYLPSEAVVLLISAVLVSAAAVLFLIASKKKKD